MKKFDVEITETLQRTVSVEADSRAEAERLVTEAWNNEDYVLDSTDFVGVDLHLQAMKAIHNLTVLRHWTRVFGLIMNIQRDFLFHPAQLHGQY